MIIYSVLSIGSPGRATEKISKAFFDILTAKLASLKPVIDSWDNCKVEFERAVCHSGMNEREPVAVRLFSETAA